MAKSTPKDTVNKLNTRKRVQVFFDKEERLTKQAFKDECDINNIISKFLDTSQLPPSRSDAQFGDCPDQEMDLKTAIDISHQAKVDYENLTEEQKTAFGGFENYAKFLTEFDPNLYEFEEDSDADFGEPKAVPKETSENSPEGAS